MMPSTAPTLQPALQRGTTLKEITRHHLRTKALGENFRMHRVNRPQTRLKSDCPTENDLLSSQAFYKKKSLSNKVAQILKHQYEPLTQAATTSFPRPYSARSHAPWINATRPSRYIRTMRRIPKLERDSYMQFFRQTKLELPWSHYSAKCERMCSSSSSTQIGHPQELATDSITEPLCNKHYPNNSLDKIYFPRSQTESTQLNPRRDSDAYY